MKLLFVVSELAVGGAERQLVLLARGLAARGDAVLLAVFRPGGALQSEAEAAGLRVIAIGGGRLPSTFLRLRRLIAVERPDVVHGYLTAGNIASLCALTLIRRPRIAWGVRASNMDMRRYGVKWRLASSAEIRCAGLADLVIVNSQAGKQVLLSQGVPEAAIAVIENGIDFGRLAPPVGAREAIRSAWGIAPDRLVIGHVGRVDPMKDHATFFAGLAMLRERRQDWVAVVVASGSDSERAVLKEQTAAMGLETHVLIEQGSQAMGTIYSGFDLFCSSSAYGEGFSNVIGEALASGLPVVATDVGDAALLVDDAGIIVPPGDPRRLAAALERGLDEREALAARAPERARRFSVEGLVARTAHALEAAVAPSHRSV